MNRKTVIISAILFYSILAAAQDFFPGSWEEFSHSAGKIRLTGWMKNTAADILSKKKNNAELDTALPPGMESSGLFITLIRKGKVRGCYGAFSHMYSSPAEILRNYIKGAIYLDPRHNPLERYELDETEIVLTITSDPEPVADINSVDISNFGVFIECDDSAKTVIVPAEYRTTSGIMKTAGNGSCRIYRFRAVTIR